MESTFDYNENLEYALEHVGGVLLNHTKLMEQFKKKSYASAFETYEEEEKAVFASIERACLAKEEEKDQIIESCIKRALDDFEASMSTMGKGQKKSYMENCKMVLALYTIPMILDLKMDISEDYADRFIELWVERYPKYVFRKGTYESLVEGFQKKGFCYITTAVCEQYEKPDDCYELMMFRNFRDGYLLKTEEGGQLVSAYYEVAPRILASIEMQEDKEVIYQEIWKNYLNPCLSMIENGQDESCMKLYKNMVNSLNKRYIS